MQVFVTYKLFTFSSILSKYYFAQSCSKLSYSQSINSHLLSNTPVTVPFRTRNSSFEFITRLYDSSSEHVCSPRNREPSKMFKDVQKWWNYHKKMENLPGHCPTSLSTVSTMMKAPFQKQRKSNSALVYLLKDRPMFLLAYWPLLLGVITALWSASNRKVLVQTPLHRPPMPRCSSRTLFSTPRCIV